MKNLAERGCVLTKLKSYSDEFKEQTIKECREIGNTALVTRRHEIAKNTAYT